MRTAFVAFVAAAAIVVAPVAHASFSPAQATQLAQGSTIVEPLDYAKGGHRYVGGVSYLVIDDDAAHLSSIARDVSRFWELMPNVVEAKLLSIAPSGKATVRITHKVGPMQGSYSVVIAFSDGGTFGRFFLDPKADNAIDDAWGFVRLTPLDGGRRTLVTWAVLFDLGPGVLRTLFETRIKKAALSYPSRLAHAAKH